MPAHKHADVIKAWADGAQIESEIPRGSGNWHQLRDPQFLEEGNYRVKPEVVYPKTQVAIGQLFRTFNSVIGLDVGLEEVANAAIRHAIDAGQVIINKDYKHD